MHLSAYYFNSIGYKYISKYHKIIVQDFQRHVGLIADGIIGSKTYIAMDMNTPDVFCPYVFKPIKPYIPYTDKELAPLLSGKLRGLAKAFNDAAKANNFDVLHAIAHAALESGWGTSYIAEKTNNLFGWAAYDSSPLASAKRFATLEECITKWSEWFNKYYLEETGKYYNGNCEQGVNVKYATSPIAGVNKAFIVAKLEKDLTK